MSSPKPSAKAVAEIKGLLKTGEPEGDTVLDLTLRSAYSESIVSLALRQLEDQGEAHRYRRQADLWFPVGPEPTE